jgi:outer membrane protein assembly factor BamB
MTRHLLAVFLLLPALTLAACGGGGSSTASAPSSEAGAPSGAVAPSKPLSGPVAYAPSPLGAWPGFAREGRHSGSEAAVGPQSAHVLWKRRLGGPVVPGPAIGKGGVVYAAANDGVLHAIDLRDGHDLWSFDGGAGYGQDLSTVPALLADGTVVWPGPQNSIFGLSPSGDLLWRVKLASQPLSPVVLPDGSVVVGDQSGDVEDLVPRSSGSPTVSWHVDLGGTSYASPTVGPDATVYTATDKTLVAIRGGHVIWRFAGASESEVSPAVSPDGTVVFGTNDSEYGISSDGKELWRHANGTRTFSSPIVTKGGLAYYGDNEGFVNVLDVGDGKLLARIGMESRPGVWSSPVVDAHHDVYFGTQAGDIDGYDAAGKRLFSLPTGGPVESYPALAADGTLLIGSESGTLYALRAR